MKRPRLLSSLVVSVLAFGVLSPALAGLIFTASVEDVVRHSSHIALGRWDGQTKELRVDTWLRGVHEEDVVRVRGMPWFVSHGIGDLSVILWGVEEDGKKPKTDRLYAFLEKIDGRLHLAGYRRYGEGFAAHASVAVVTDSGAVLRFIQQENPGSPSPCPVGTSADFRKELEEQIKKIPYEPPPTARPPIAYAQRESFFEALGDAVDWYQGAPHTELRGWGDSGLDAEKIRLTAMRLAAWVDAAPIKQRVHGLDAMMMLCRIVQGGGPDTSAVEARVLARLKKADPAATRAWIMRELRHGVGVNRAAFGRLAKGISAEVYAEAVGLLEGWVERTDFGEGTDSYWALVSLGHEDLADAAAARRRARDAGK